MHRRPSRATRGLALVVLAAALAACSSAPAPAALDQVAGDGTQAGGVDPVTGQPLPAGSSAPGTAGAAGGTAGGTTGGATSATTGGAAGTGGGGTTGGSTGSTAGSAGTTGGAVTPGTTGGASGVRSRLFTPAENTIGITPNLIRMCAHAALTYGAAFNTTAEDFNVFWTELNSKGGIFGRKVEVSYENDNYDAATAKTAATACNAKKPFILLGGIGFDQIPNVRLFAEQNHVLYLHHTATEKGTEGQRYSFTELPSVERLGEAFAQLAASKYKTKKIGIIERDSANWAPGTDAFKAGAKRFGLNIVAVKKVAINQGNYTNEIVAMKNAGAEVVFGWENALVSTQILKQAKAQVYSPQWLLFPFNLTSQTLENDALQPALDGVAMYPAYSFGDRSGSFSSYADDLAEFESQYRKHRPNVDLQGVGGDLLFLNWTAQKALAAQLRDCGKDCTRNGFVDVLKGYKKVPTSSACLIDFTTGNGQRGADRVNFLQTYRAPSGKVNWRNTRACVGRP